MEKKIFEAPAAPENLSEESKVIWSKLIDRCKSAGRQALLQNALECLDRANEAKEIVQKEGMTQITESTKAIHLHPLLKVEKDNRALFAKIIGQLSLDWSQLIDGR